MEHAICDYLYAFRGARRWGTHGDRMAEWVKRAKSPGERDKTGGRCGKRSFKRPVNSRAVELWCISCLCWMDARSSGARNKTWQRAPVTRLIPLCPQLPWQRIGALLFEMSNNAHKTKEWPDNRPLQAAFSWTDVSFLEDFKRPNNKNIIGCLWGPESWI